MMGVGPGGLEHEAVLDQLLQDWQYDNSAAVRCVRMCKAIFQHFLPGTTPNKRGCSLHFPPTFHVVVPSLLLCTFCNAFEG